jgi:hypothetical protein
MPEEPELDLDKFHEEIHERVEHERDWILKAIALTTALFAAFAAVAALQAGGTVNEALLLKTEATRLQAEASDQWADYQAKGIKAAIQAASESAWTAAGKAPPPSFAIEQQRYASKQHELSAVAHDKERERDLKEHEADRLLHRHHRFANSVALFQVAIALGAVAALTRMRLVWYGSIALGITGIGLLTSAII